MCDFLPFVCLTIKNSTLNCFLTIKKGPIFLPQAFLFRTTRTYKSNLKKTINFLPFLSLVLFTIKNLHGLGS